MQTIILNGLELSDLLSSFRAIVREEMLSHTPKPGQQSPDIAGIALAEEITGLARQTVYGLVSKRQIPHLKRGKKLYFSRQALEQWIADGKRPTVSEAHAKTELATKKR